ESVMIRLRYNCQWDREQTSQSIKNHLIEEAYEVWDAIQKGDINKFKSELGDLLLQVIFHSQINSDFKNFNFYDVLKTLVQKLIDRHPHVFNINEIHSNIEKILVDWEKNKAKENKEVLVDIPKSMPSLLKLYLLYRKIKRLKMLEKFNDFINQKLEIFDPSEKQILQTIYSFYLHNSQNLEEVINKFVDKLINEINQTQFLKIEN
ncbi:MAG: MazG nucleotide pyrophosphohydrolase domain-containing protein, partial [bacterium]